MSSPCYEPSSYFYDLVLFPAVSRARSEGHSTGSTAETLKRYAYHKRQRYLQWSIPLPAVIVSFHCSQDLRIAMLPSCFTSASFSHSGFHLNIPTPAQLSPIAQPLANTINSLRRYHLASFLLSNSII